MKKITIAIVGTFFLLTSMNHAIGAELANQGEGAYKAGMSWTFKTLPMEKDRLEMQFDVAGVALEAPENSPLYNATFWALGQLHAVKGEYEERNFIRYTRPDGDHIFGTYEAKGKLRGERKIRLIFVGGTGKCVGISSEGDFRGLVGLRPPKEDIGMSVTIGQFNWEIP
jgi:hypothetical protein